MPVIIYDIDLFSQENPVFIFNENINGQFTYGKYSVEDFVNILPTICKQFNSYNIHLYGNTNFCNGVADEIMSVSPSNYNYNKLRIEVN